MRSTGGYVKSILVLAVMVMLLAAPLAVLARKHHLEVRVSTVFSSTLLCPGAPDSHAVDLSTPQNDRRPYIALSTFGFYTNGHLDVQLSKLTIDEEQSTDLVRINPG